MLKKITMFVLLLILANCNISNKGTESPIVERGPDGSPGVVEEFNYQTVKPVEVIIKTKYSGVLLNIYDSNNKLLATLQSKSPMITAKISVPNTSAGLYVRTEYVGLPNEVYLPIENYKAILDFDQETNMTTMSSQLKIGFLKSTALYQSISNFPQYAIMGSWDHLGVPDYLVARKEISKDLIEQLNEILPEKKPVPEYHPQYLLENIDTGLHIVKTGEVFVTFVHEGAGYRNSLGYYTYTTSDGPPESIDPNEITLVFPNVSYRYGGGGLYSGDTVNLGEFNANTSIGWVLISNAYNSRLRGVSGGLNTFYSESSLNPDVAPHQQHFVQIDLQDFIALGIEDLKRPGGDNDFNDAVFTVSSNPLDAIDKSGLISDTSEKYTSPEPDEEIELQEPPLFELSGYQFFPGKGEYGTLAFEDLWPHKGDYDFNDLVIDYNVIEALNTENKIVQIELSLRIVGILASMRNGFGLQLGVKPEDIASVTGVKRSKNYTVTAANGTEKRQEKAVIIAFEDAQLHYNSASPDESELIKISINFNRGIDRTELGFAPYNPFIMSNGERGREIHLPGYQPTNLVHTDYFGSIDDDSVIGTNYMYKTDGDLPWAIHLPEKFSYPYDSVKIYDAFLLFEDWVNSDGFSHADWYTNKPGYREEKLIRRK